MRRKITLAEKQDSMRLRQLRNTHPGPRAKTDPTRDVRPVSPVVERYEFERRLRAHALLQLGWSLSRVAERLGFPVEVLQDWDGRGRPLVYLAPQRIN